MHDDHSDPARPPLPPDEWERLEALRRYGAFGMLRAAAFDDIARLAAFICETPIALISLVDTNRQWFLSQSGIDACETSREASFCAHALVGNEMLVVEDARLDARFARNPLVAGEPHIRFYAGAPLLTPDGYALGTLCVVDVVPRTLSAGQKEALQSLSRLVMTQMEMSRLKREMRTLKQSFSPRPAPRY
jgi:GAF domain-containing protein